MSALPHLKSARSAAIDALEESDWKDETARRAAYLADAAIREIEYGIPAHSAEVIEAEAKLVAVLEERDRDAGDAPRCSDCGALLYDAPNCTDAEGNPVVVRDCSAGCGFAEVGS